MVSAFEFFDKSAPSYIPEMILPLDRGRVTRRSKHELNQTFTKSNRGQNGLSYLGPKIWSNLHSNLKSAESVKSFQHENVDMCVCVCVCVCNFILIRLFTIANTIYII